MSNQYAITSNDLTENIGKVAGVAGSAGVSFEELTGLMVSSVEKTRNASKSANAFKSIFINLQQMNESGTMPKLSEQFKEFGIEMTDASGATKDAFDLLNELATAYQNVSASTDVEKQNKMKSLLEDIGGKYNYNVLISSLTGFQTAIDATNTALNSANSAQIEFDKAMDSVAKRAEGTKGAFQELVWGNGGLDEFLKTLLSGTTSVLKFMTDTKALNVILIDLGIILTATLLPKMLSFGSTLLTNIGLIALTSAETGSLSLGLKAVGISATTAQIAMGSLIAVISIGVLAYNKFKSVQEEEAMVRKQATDEAMHSIEAINLAMESLQDEALTRETLNGVVDSNLSKYSEEISKIDDLNLARAKTIALLQEEKLAKAESLTSTGMSDFLSAKDRMSETNDKQSKTFSFSGGSAIISGDNTSDYVENLKAFKEQLQETNAIANESAIGKIEAEIAKYGEEVAKDTETINQMNEALRIQGKVYDDTTGTVRDMTYAEAEKAKATKESKDATDGYVDSEDELLDSAEESLSVEEARAKALADSLDATNAIISSVDELSSAFQEEAENGEISVATQLKMIEDGYALALSYDATTGACTINKEAVIALMEAKIQEQIANLTLLRTDLATKMRNDASVALTSAGAFLALANAKGSALSNLTGGGSKADKTQLASYDAQIKVLQNSLKSVKNVGTGAFSGIAKSAGGAGKATSKATDAIKKQKEALEKLKSNYERAINYIKKKLDEDIDKLEEDKDKALESVDAKIDALNKQRDAEEKYWDDKIDALDEQNDALQTQIELEQKLEAVAKAKSTKVMIYKDGQWQYGQDESAVSSAEEDLYDFQENLKREQQVKDLEAMKDKVLANLDAQIDGWEAYKDNLEKNYDSQIDYLKKYKENFENMVNSYSDAQDKLLAEQLTGINFEKGNWDTRLGNLQTFIASYNSILSQLDTFDDSALDGGGGSSGGGGGSSSGGTTTPSTPKSTGFKGSVKYTGKYPITWNGATYRTGQTVEFKGGSAQDVASQIAQFIKVAGKSFASQIGGIAKYASGVSSVGADQMAIVGDDPNKNQELVAGSRASGKLMNLAKGTRVIDNGNTKLLGSLVNTFSKSGFIDSTTGMTTANTNNVSNNNGMTINGGITIMANNPSEFENYFKRYNSNMLQKSFAT